jgi:hypothetical protein
MFKITMEVNGNEVSFNLDTQNQVDTVKGAILKKIVKSMVVTELYKVSSCYYRNERGKYWLYCKSFEKTYKFNVCVDNKIAAFNLRAKILNKGFIDITKWCEV